MDRRWSETGDRYLLKLFRDYVFHQVDEQGKPLVDLGHVLEALNKVSRYCLFPFQLIFAAGRRNRRKDDVDESRRTILFDCLISRPQELYGDCV